MGDHLGRTRYHGTNNVVSKPGMTSLLDQIEYLRGINAKHEEVTALQDKLLEQYRSSVKVLKAINEATQAENKLLRTLLEESRKNEQA